MYCGNCGELLPYGTSSCPNCGMQVGYGTNYCKNCGQPVSYSSSYCPNCGACLGHGSASGRVYPAGKSRIAAGVLGVILGGLGVHNFYLGYTGRGIAQLILTLCSFGIGSVWGFVEGILLLCGGYKQTDASGRYLDK